MAINRKSYETPTMSALVCDAEDIIRTSTGAGAGATTNELITNFDVNWITGSTNDDGV